MATKQTQAVMMAKVRATPIPCADCGREFTRTSPNQKRCPECQAKRVKAQAAQRRAAAATRPAKSGRLAWQEFLDAALSRVREGLYTSCTECYRALLGREWATPVPKLGAFAKYWQAHRMADLIPGAPEPSIQPVTAIPPAPVVADPPPVRQAMPGECTRQTIQCVPEPATSMAAGIGQPEQQRRRQSWN